MNEKYIFKILIAVILSVVYQEWLTLHVEFTLHALRNVQCLCFHVLKLQNTIVEFDLIWCCRTATVCNIKITTL